MDNENNRNYENDPSNYDYDNNYHYNSNPSGGNDYGGSYDCNSVQKPADPYQPNGFASAALTLGILSLTLCCCCYVSIPLAALGILFAILSKGKEPHMQGRAKTGIVLSTIGLGLTILLTCVSLLVLMNNTGSRKQVKEYMEYYMGDDFDSDSLDEFFRNYGGYDQDDHDYGNPINPDDDIL